MSKITREDALNITVWEESPVRSPSFPPSRWRPSVI